MKNKNKARLLHKFIREYPFSFEREYNLLSNKAKYIRDDDFENLGMLFDEYQDYIIDFFVSDI